VYTFEISRKTVVYKSIKGDEVAERTNRSVATRTVAGSNFDHGRHLFPCRHLSGERGRHPPTGHGRNIFSRPKTIYYAYNNNNILIWCSYYIYEKNIVFNDKHREANVFKHEY